MKNAERDIKDLRERVSDKLMATFVELVNDFKVMLDNSKHTEYDMLCLDYYVHVGNDSSVGDEELLLQYKDGKLVVSNMEHVVTSWNETTLLELGSYFEGRIGDTWEHSISRGMAFEKLDALVSSMESLIAEQSH